MKTHEETRKEKMDVMYVLAGISADVSQLSRAYFRREPKGVKKNIKQIIAKLEKINKKL